VLLLLLFSSTSFSDVYKWVDDNGQTHYSQQAPRDRDAQVIKAPPPPSIAPAIAQEKLKDLIEQQEGTHEEREQQRQLAREEAELNEQNKESCRINRHNLQQHQNNPGRRMIDSDGNVTEANEEQRQEKILEIQQRLDQHCQEY